MAKTFEEWFCDCIIYCATNFVGPDDYKWDLHNCDRWKARFQQGMSAVEAVQEEFDN